MVTPGSRAQLVPGSTTVHQEVADQSAVGEVFVESLIRAQLRLALLLSAGFLLAVAGSWALVRWAPVLTQWRLAGIPAAWLLLAVGLYPVIGLCAWVYVRMALRNEARYRELVDEG